MEAPSTQTARLEIPPSEWFLPPTVGYIKSFAERMGMHSSRSQRLGQASEAALGLVIRCNGKTKTEERIAIELSESEGCFVLEVLNRGVPVFLKKDDEALSHFEKVSVQNLGRQGQTLLLGMRLGEEAAQRALGEDSRERTPEIRPDTPIHIRELKAGEEGALSQLFYFVYGYQYINEFVYYPEKLASMREDGRLISVVAATEEGRLLGHVGLVKWGKEPAVYEPCLGVVDPTVKSRGLFSQIFQRTMEQVEATPMQYCFFDFVTNHDFSQRLVAKYNPCELALFVGCQSKSTQAKLSKLGLGQDSIEMDRYSLLYSILPQVDVPFGKEVRLPNNLGELLGFLLKPLNLSWCPTSRFELLPPEGDEYQTQLQPAQNAVIFDFKRPGRNSVERMLKQWHELLRNGYQYAGVEVPVDCQGLGVLYDILAEYGFFVSGFVPYHHSARLAMRFQAIGPTKVAFDDIKVFTPTAKQLLSIVRQNYERNGLL